METRRWNSSKVSSGYQRVERGKKIKRQSCFNFLVVLLHGLAFHLRRQRCSWFGKYKSRGKSTGEHFTRPSLILLWACCSSFSPQGHRLEEHRIIKKKTKKKKTKKNTAESERLWISHLMSWQLKDRSSNKAAWLHFHSATNCELSWQTFWELGPFHSQQDGRS